MFSAFSESELVEIIGFLLSQIILFLGLSFIYFPVNLTKRKKKAWLYFIISISLILIGYSFKINHWPGAGLLVITGVIMFCMSYLPLLVVNRFDRWKNFTSNKLHTLVVSISDLLSILAISYGALAKFMHWPGATYSFISGAILFVTSFVGWNMIFKRSLQKSRESEDRLADTLAELKIKHEIIEEKHREITDSINYAERLQKSLMASNQMLDQHLKNYFIYFNPKEKVSGDFYWCHTLSNGNFLLACADSTGHGVPGAIMSMMNMNSLKEAVKEGLQQPADILNRTREIIIQTLKNDGSSEGGKDGMDCILLSFNFTTNTLYTALANNPLWIIRDGKLLEYSPDKMPVGKHDKQDLPFSQHSITLQKDDLVIAITDGYADQFGGAKGKKFKYNNLQNLLLETATQQPQVIKNKLQNAFDQWKGDLEQVDDVCLIGIKI